ncbi:MAG: hypothetical protein R3F34_11295 [Planctomycetota bacterium]
MNESGERTTRSKLLFLAILLVLAVGMFAASKLFFVGLDERVRPDGPTGVRDADAPSDASTVVEEPK